MSDDAPKIPATKPIKKKNAAAELLKKKVVLDASRKQKALESENTDKVFFLKCPRVKGHVAAWLTEKPVSGKIHPGMWESLHHAAGDPWTRTYIPCQECYVEGESRVWAPHLRAERREDGNLDFVFACERKHVVGEMSRAELEGRREMISAAVGGGESGAASPDAETEG